MFVNFKQLPQLHFLSQSILQPSSRINDSLFLALDVILRDEHLLDVRLAGVDVNARVFLDGRSAAALSCDWDCVQVKSCRDALEHTLCCQFRSHTCTEREQV